MRVDRSQYNYPVLVLFALFLIIHEDITIIIIILLIILFFAEVLGESSGAPVLTLELEQGGRPTKTITE